MIRLLSILLQLFPSKTQSHTLKPAAKTAVPSPKGTYQTLADLSLDEDEDVASSEVAEEGQDDATDGGIEARPSPAELDRILQEAGLLDERQHIASIRGDSLGGLLE